MQIMDYKAHSINLRSEIQMKLQSVYMNTRDHLEDKDMDSGWGKGGFSCTCSYHGCIWGERRIAPWLGGGE